MNPVAAVRNVLLLLKKLVGSIHVFFVRWFLPLPAVDKLEDDNRWNMDEDEPERRATPPLESGVPTDETKSEPDGLQSAPEIRPPEGAEDRAGRQPNMPNPFA